MNRRLYPLPLAPLPIAAAALGQGRATSAIDGKVFLSGQTDHAGTAVSLTGPGSPAPVAVSAVAVTLLLAALLRRRRPRAALGLLLLAGTAALAAVLAQTSSDTSGAYSLR